MGSPGAVNRENKTVTGAPANWAKLKKLDLSSKKNSVFHLRLIMMLTLLPSVDVGLVLVL